MGCVGAVAVTTLLTLASASAVTVTPITPGSSTLLQPETSYTYETVKPVASNVTNQHDQFTFTYAGNITSNTLQVSAGIDPLAGFSGAFTSLVANWIDLTASVTIPFLIAPPASSGGLFSTLLTAGHSYMLEVIWSTGANTAASYHTTVSTGPGSVINPTPLPPAAVLFVSALAGLGLLGRRRKSKAIAS
jgi:hypothetical protein